MKAQVHLARNIDHPLPLFAWAIIFVCGRVPWDKSAPSHMALSFKIKGEPMFFIDMSVRGFKSQTKEDFLKRYRIVKSHQLNGDIDKLRLENWYSRNANKKYDWLQIFGLLMRSFGFSRINIIGKDMKKMVCTEAIVDFLYHFYGFEYGDPDNYDLNNTWMVVENY